MVTTIACLQTSASEKVWSPSEMMKVKPVSDVQISPSNEEVLFVTTEVITKEEKNSYHSSIYKKNLSSNELQALSNTENSAAQPRWSPDGKFVAFLEVKEKVKNLCVVNSEGGEVKVLTEGSSSVQNFAWSPDSTKIAFIREDSTELEKNRTKTSSAYVYKEKTKVNRLLVIDIASSQTTALTSDEYCVRGGGDFGTYNIDFDWSPDAKSIAFAYTPGIGYDYFHLDSSIAVVDLETLNITPWVKKTRFEACPRYSPHGEWIAYLFTDSTNGYSIDRSIAIRSTITGEMKLLAETFNGGPLLFGASLLGWSHEGEEVLFFEPKETKFHIVATPIDGSAARTIDMGDVFFKNPTLSLDRKSIGFISESFNTPPEAFVSSLNSFAPKKVSFVNGDLSTSLKTERFKWQSSDGLTIEGLVIYPKGYEEGKAYPTLLVIHGGPMGFYYESFVGTANIYPTAAFAEAGFIVFEPNPRGSTGYGKNFRHANYSDWGGMDFEDLMTGVDALIAKGVADPDKLGVMGWSYGGYMTGRTVTQTNRFKAASMGAGLYNLVSMNGTTDLHRFLTDYLGDSLENPEIYLQRSPINYIPQIQTPCLIQHGTMDTRVPVTQSYELYHALERAGKNPTLVLYPDMNHHISDPDMYLDCMQRNLDWFSKHLLQK